MKSPFAILIAAVLVIGIAIGGVAIFVVGPTDQDGSSSDTIPIASQSDLPTPSTRTEPARSRSDSSETSSEVVGVATSESVEKVSSDEDSDVEASKEDNEPQVVVTIEVTTEETGQGGPGRFGGGSPDGPNFQAIQEAIQSNPEIAAIIQKAQSGNISQEEQDRLREFMQEALAEAGIEAPSGRGGFANAPTQGTITAINSSTITLQAPSSSETNTDVEVGEQTNITVVRSLEPSDLSVGANVAGAVRRGDGGRIFIVILTVLPQNAGGGFGFGGLGAGAGDTSVSAIQGTVAEIADDTVHVETTQGTLRLTANDESMIISTSPATLDDLSEGMGAIAFGPLEDGAVQARSIVAGAQELINQQGGGGLRGAGRRGPGQ